MNRQLAILSRESSYPLLTIVSHHHRVVLHQDRYRILTIDSAPTLNWIHDMNGLMTTQAWKRRVTSTSIAMNRKMSNQQACPSTRSSRSIDQRFCLTMSINSRRLDYPRTCSGVSSSEWTRILFQRVQIRLAFPTGPLHSIFAALAKMQ